MKNMKHLSALLCLIVLLQCLVVPGYAQETTQSETTQETQAMDAAAEAVQQTSQIPFGSVCIQNGCRTINGMYPLGGSDRKMDTAQATFVYETNTDTVVYSYNADTKMSPGTLTKIVLCLVTIENCALDEVVTCSEGIQSKVPGSALHVSPNSLKSGEQLSVEDLLHCVLLLGANDAAVALAEHVAGTTTAFLQLMNQRVKQMGCANTEFGNISGLDTATSYSTARDMAKIVTEATKNETFTRIFGTTDYTVPATNLVEERTFRTTNYLIDNYNISQFLNSNVTGGLPSYTANSGASLACVAESNGMRLVFVSLGSQRLLDEEESWKVTYYGNFEEMIELIKYVLDNFKPNRIVYDGMTVNQWAVAGGESEAVGLATVNVDSIVPAGVQMRNLIFNYNVEGGGLSAPISKGQRIATAELWYQNSCLTEVELFAMSDVKASADSGVSIRTVGSQTDENSGGIMSVIGTICVIILGLVGAYLGFNSYMRSRVRAQRRKRRADRRRSR